MILIKYSNSIFSNINLKHQKYQKYYYVEWIDYYCPIIIIIDALSCTVSSIILLQLVEVGPIWTILN